MMLLLLAVVRNDLLNDWRRSLPADTPNFFFINIPPDEHQAVHAVPRRARRAARARAADGSCAHDAHQRQVRSTTSSSRRRAAANSPTATRTSPGRKRSATTTRSPRATGSRAEDVGKPLVSVSTEYMEELNLKLGDELQFDIAGETRAASDLERAQGEVGQLPAELLPHVRAGSARRLAGHLDDGRAPATRRNPKTIADLVRRFPSVSVFNVDDLLRQVRSVIDKAAGRRAERLPVHAARGPRGADRGGAGEPRRTPLRKRHAAHARRESQHGAQGTAGGVRGARRAVGMRSPPAGASIAGVYIARRVLQIPYTPDPWVWFYGLVGGGLLVCFAGWLATRSVVNQPPVLTLAGCVMTEDGPVRRVAPWSAGTTRACSRTRPTRWPSPTSSAATPIRGSSKRSPASRRTNSTIRSRRVTSGSTTSRTSVTAGIRPTPSPMPSRSLTLDARARRRDAKHSQPASVLVFGGDEVYPVSHARRIRRAHRDARTAIAFAGRAHPDVFAIPGNHDWYDSLVAFSRTFCRPERGFAGCPTRQTRSYFALQSARQLVAAGHRPAARRRSRRAAGAVLPESRRAHGRRRAPHLLRAGAALDSRRRLSAPLELRRALEHAVSRGESLQAQGARVPHRRPAFLQAPRKRGGHPEDHLGRWRRIPASHARAGHQRTAQWLRAARGVSGRENFAAARVAEFPVPVHQSEVRMAVRISLRHVGLAGFGESRSIRRHRPADRARAPR